MTEDKAFRTFIRTYSLFNSERFSVNIKLTFYKALIRYVMIYVCKVSVEQIILVVDEEA
jgi:hypothetical protein